MKRVVRAKQAWAQFGIGRSMFEQRFVETGRLRPIKLGARAVGYLESELDALIDELIAERDANIVPRRPRLGKAA
jgi:predicted DNA-binding transcriptional regulator AlpA